MAAAAGLSAPTSSPALQGSCRRPAAAQAAAAGPIAPRLPPQRHNLRHNAAEISPPAAPQPLLARPQPEEATSVCGRVQSTEAVRTADCWLPRAGWWWRASTRKLKPHCRGVRRWEGNSTDSTGALVGTEEGSKRERPGRGCTIANKASRPEWACQGRPVKLRTQFGGRCVWWVCRREALCRGSLSAHLSSPTPHNASDLAHARHSHCKAVPLRQSGGSTHSSGSGQPATHTLPPHRHTNTMRHSAQKALRLAFSPACGSQSGVQQLSAQLRSLTGGTADVRCKAGPVPEGHANSDLSPVACHIGLGRRRDLSLRQDLRLWQNDKCLTLSDVLKVWAAAGVGWPADGCRPCATPRLGATPTWVVAHAHTPCCAFWPAALNGHCYRGCRGNASSLWASPAGRCVLRSTFRATCRR